jgi:hypothetical protein
LIGWPRKKPFKKLNEDDNIASLLAEAESIKDNADAYLPQEELALA